MTTAPPAPRLADLSYLFAARPVVATERDQLRQALADAEYGTRAVVMTMGALHAGHAALIREARARAEHVTVTIFVNPLQFGAGEDLGRYPRTLAADLELCAREGVDVVYAPTAVHTTPPLVRVAAGPGGEVLEGASRPGHFDGMLTIVATLLNLVRPDLAFFGQKDAQQLSLVRRMADDLGFGVEIVAVPTVRDDDGVALSSRNRFLSPADRVHARALSRALAAGAGRAPCGPAAVLAAAQEVLDAEPGVDVDYLALVDASDLGTVRPGADALLLVAARVGSTRLIDNMPLRCGEPDA